MEMDEMGEMEELSGEELEEERKYWENRFDETDEFLQLRERQKSSVKKFLGRFNRLKSETKEMKELSAEDRKRREKLLEENDDVDFIIDKNTVLVISNREIELTKEFFSDVLGLDILYSDNEFIKHITDTGIFDIVDDSVSYHGEKFEVVDGTVTEMEIDTLRTMIMDDYDRWAEERNRKVLKKAGIITAIGLTVIALVTGLSVGLTRKGNDLVYQSKKWEKLKPSDPRKKSVIWTDLTDATGRSLIFTGRYLTVILVTSVIYLAVKKRKTVR